jgi:hypothetical protein
MTRVAKASSETRSVHPNATGRTATEPEAPIFIAQSISSPSPWFSGCRQLVWKGWGRGRGNRLQGHVLSGPRSCHSQKWRHRRRYRRRRDGPGTWWSFGIAQETGSMTLVPFGEKENSADASPRDPAREPRTASLSPTRRPPSSGTVVRCGFAGARKGRGRRACGIWTCNW